MGRQKIFNITDCPLKYIFLYKMMKIEGSDLNQIIRTNCTFKLCILYSCVLFGSIQLRMTYKLFQPKIFVFNTTLLQYIQIHVKVVVKKSLEKRHLRVIIAPPTAEVQEHGGCIQIINSIQRVCQSG